MNMDNVKVGMLPGYDDTVNGIWYFFHDEEETKALVDELFNDVTPDSEESQEVDDENTLAENVVNET